LRVDGREYISYKKRFQNIADEFEISDKGEINECLGESTNRANTERIGFKREEKQIGHQRWQTKSAPRCIGRIMKSGWTTIAKIHKTRHRLRS